MTQCWRNQCQLAIHSRFLRYGGWRNTELLLRYSCCCCCCFDNYYYTVSQKNDTDVAHYNFDRRHVVLIIFRRDVAERICYQMV